MKIRMSKDITQIVKFCFIGGTNTIIGSIRESIRLPKTIPLSALELLLTTIYKQCKHLIPATKYLARCRRYRPALFKRYAHIKALCTAPRQCQPVRWNDTHLRKGKQGAPHLDWK